MQSILPSTTSMKTFTIVLPVITVSTVLAVFVLTGVLQDMPRTISENIPNPGQKLRELMQENPRKRWGKEQFRGSRALGEQRSLWTYLAFLVELCFISIPVNEVKKTANLCKLRDPHPASSNRPGSSISQQHLRSNTTLASSHNPDTKEANRKTRARQVIEVQLTKRKSSHKGFILVAVRQTRNALFIAIRLLLLCLWIPLLLLDYVVLLFCCPFMGDVSAPPQPNPQRRLSKRDQLKRFFTAPFAFFDIDLSQFHTRRSRAEHEHRSPVPPTEPFDHALAPFPPSYFHLDPLAGDRPPGPGRESHVRPGQRMRNIVARPTFQAAYQQQYPSGVSPAAVPAQPSAHLRARGYSDVEGGIPRRTGGV
jgi:hypothetical protein